MNYKIEPSGDLHITTPPLRPGDRIEVRNTGEADVIIDGDVEHPIKFGETRIIAARMKEQP